MTQPSRGALAAEVINQRFSLRSRVTLLAAFCVGGAVALVSLGAFLSVKESLYTQLDESLRARAVAAVNSPLMDDVEVKNIPTALVAITDLRIALVQADGAVLYNTNVAPPPVSDLEIAVARRELPESLRTSRDDFRVVAVPYKPKTAKRGWETTALVVAEPIAPTKAALAKLNVVLIVVGGAGIVLAAAAGTAVASAGLRPVQRLTSATERVAKTGDLRPIPVTGDDELARLTESFNTMLAALTESMERQRRLVADAGHELRTPLTSLRTNLDLLVASGQPGAPELSARDRDEIYEDVRAQISELSTLVGDLVELAREDAPQVVHEPVEMVEVIERALDRARRRAGGLEFQVTLQPWRLLGDSNALERAVLNLLDNAAKWSPPGGVVSLDARVGEQGLLELTVSDQGPGIADADLPHVFERFYRSTEARTLPGSGLGLAIVRQVAERHGGTAHAARGPSGGALMTLLLPGRPG